MPVIPLLLSPSGAEASADKTGWGIAQWRNQRANRPRYDPNDLNQPSVNRS